MVQNTVLLGVAAAIGVAPAGLFPPGGILIALAIAGLAVFYLWRGPMVSTTKPGDRIIAQPSGKESTVARIVAMQGDCLALY